MEEETGGTGGGGTGGQGTGGTKVPGTGGVAGGSGGSGTGGQAEPDAGTAGAGGPPDAAAPAGDAGAPPAAAGQGPVAEGKIAYSQDFELNMDGMTRSPSNLPEDRIQIIDDPVKERGKIVRIMFKENDNFRTSPGTQPRSWFSAAKGYTVKPNTTVSVAWGFMWENVNMNAHFAQLIREGGPTWMWDVDGSGNLSMTSHRGTGRTGNLFKLEPMKWYDFMVTTNYRNGGEVKFYVNGKMVLVGTSPGGPDGRFDFGIYTRAGAHPARTVFISNVSIGEL
jgi:Concanavalin A-like lectin/glucanases superfamily